MAVLLQKTPCILPFQIKKQTPIINNLRTQIRAFPHNTYDIRVFIIAQNKFNLPVTAMLQQSFNNEKLISLHIKQPDNCTPETRADNILYSIANHSEVIP